MSQGIELKQLNRLFRLKEVEQFAGLKRTAIDELVKAGHFPKPIPLSDSGRAAGARADRLLKQPH
jgi:predicted DNA-binding transcriptional regulator AlpA